MALHVFQYSAVSKPIFVIPIESQVNQQCTGTNAGDHVKTPASRTYLATRPFQSCMPWIQPVCLAGGASGKSKQPAKMNIHSDQIGFVFFFVASGETCKGSNNFVKKSGSVSLRTRRCCKECVCLRRTPSMQPANDIQDPVCDVLCCSQTKCIRAICGIYFGEPQPRLPLWES